MGSYLQRLVTPPAAVPAAAAPLLPEIDLERAAPPERNAPVSLRRASASERHTDAPPRPPDLPSQPAPMAAHPTGAAEAAAHRVLSPGAAPHARSEASASMAPAPMRRAGVAQALADVRTELENPDSLFPADVSAPGADPERTIGRPRDATPGRSRSLTQPGVAPASAARSTLRSDSAADPATADTVELHVGAISLTVQAPPSPSVAHVPPPPALPPSTRAREVALPGGLRFSASRHYLRWS